MPITRPLSPSTSVFQILVFSRSISTCITPNVSSPHVQAYFEAATLRPLVSSQVMPCELMEEKTHLRTLVTQYFTCEFGIEIVLVVPLDHLIHLGLSPLNS